MDGENLKRKRGTNFTPRETELLLSLICNYKSVVENKKTDAVSVSEKQKIWDKITKEFNAASPEFSLRSKESLKKFYDNKKNEIRKIKAEERKEVLMTGGGPPPKVSKDSTTQEIILSILDPLSVSGGDNNFDSDKWSECVNTGNNDDSQTYVFQLHSNDIDEESQSIVEQNSEAEETINYLEAQESTVVDQRTDKLNNTIQTSWNKQSVQNLKMPKNPALLRTSISHSTPIKSPTGRKINPARRRPAATVVRSLASSSLAEKYSNLADIKQTVEEYNLKKVQTEIENMTNEHKLRCDSLKLDIEIKKQKLKQYQCNGTQ